MSNAKMVRVFSRLTPMLALLAGACTQTDTAKNDTTGKDSGSASATAAAAPPTTDPPASAPKPFAQMQPADWAKHLADDVKLNAALRDTAKTRACGNKPGHSQNCSLTFTPVYNTHLVEHAVLDTTNGATVLGVVENLGTESESTFSIPAGRRVVWVVSKGTSYLLDPLNEYKPVITKKFTVCHRDPPPAKASAAGFYYCGTSPHRKPDGTYGLALSADSANKIRAQRGQKALPFNEHTRPPWIACAEGCCNVDGQQ